MVDGGFASHVLVPHPRYLLDYDPLPPALAGAYMCSGLTAYAALKRLSVHAARGPLLLLGLGGVGMMGLSFALAMFPHAPFVADIDGPNARRRSRPARPRPSIRPTRMPARRCWRRPTAARTRFDFVGSDKSLQFAIGVIAKGAKIAITGLIGGSFTTPVAMFPLKAMTVEGTLTGTLVEAREMMALARAGKVPPVPVHERRLGEANAALDDLRAGRVVGRVVRCPKLRGIRERRFAAAPSPTTGEGKRG